MAKEFYGYFDSTEGDIRQYDAAELALLLSAAVRNGVSSHNGGGLEVSADGRSMRTKVSYGGAVIGGYVYELSDDGSGQRTFTHPVSGTADRIDRIVVRLDLNQRKISMALLEGVPSAVPVPPVLTRNSHLWELSLAQVRIPASAMFVEDENITDERGNETVCGYAIPVWFRREMLDDYYVLDQPITDAEINSAIT